MVKYRRAPKLDNGESSWKHMADWAEFRAEQLRHDATAAEKHVGTPPSFAYAASLRAAADVMEKDAKLWRFNADQKKL